MLAVLQRAERTPEDLSAHAVALAGQLLEFCGHSEPGTGILVTQRSLDNGVVWVRFQAVCKAQGGLHEPQRVRLRKSVLAERDGMVHEVDGRRLARVAKLAGAPKAPATGFELHVELEDRVGRGVPLLTVHTETLDGLGYVFDYLEAHPLIDVGDSR